MYFKIEKSGCGERKGLLQISFACYFDEGEPGYMQYYRSVPVVTGEYRGVIGKDGVPEDQKDYDDWIKSLPTAMQNTPFCTHIRFFPPDVGDKDIVKAGDEVVKMAYDNYQVGDIKRNRNTAIVPDMTKAYLLPAKVADVLTKDFTLIADKDSTIRGISYE